MKGRSLAEIATGAVVLLVAAGFLVYAVLHSGRAVATGGMTLQARFDRVDGLAPGAEVRLAGVRVGSVVEQRIDPETFLAVVTLRVDPSLRLPADTSAEITSESLLGGKYVALVPGGAERILQPGGEIEITQSPVSLENLLGRFIFSVTEMNTQNRQPQAAPDEGAPVPAPAPSLAPPPAPAPAPR